MPKPIPVHSYFGGTSSISLVGAFLLYRGSSSGGLRERLSYDHEQNNTSFRVVTAHGIEGREIGPGKLVTREAAAEFARTLLEEQGGPSQASILPPQILYTGVNTLIWHCPPQPRQLWFQVSTAGSDRKADRDRLNKLSGDKFPQPHLLFVAGHDARQFKVFALKGRSRPTAATALFRAPYFNVDDSGTLCIGTTRFPKTVHPSNYQRFEEAFFKSAFTHPTGGARIAAQPQWQLWPALRGRRAFPEKLLLPNPGPKTVRQLLAAIK